MIIATGRRWALLLQMEEVDTRTVGRTSRLARRAATSSDVILQTNQIKADPKTPFKIPNRKYHHISNECNIHSNTSAYRQTQLASSREVEIRTSHQIAHTNRIIMLGTKMRGARTCREMATVRSIISSANLWRKLPQMRYRIKQIHHTWRVVPSGQDQWIPARTTLWNSIIIRAHPCPKTTSHSFDQPVETTWAVALSSSLATPQSPQISQATHLTTASKPTSTTSNIAQATSTTCEAHQQHTDQP